ncbi:hypothetical protein QYF36_025247 [Acer negundo]|nr:hypothetical protein QYF36_025247 [Acer negundo]
MAIRFGIRLAMDSGLVSFQVESDSLHVVNMVNKGVIFAADVGPINISDILSSSSLSHNWSIGHVMRTANPIYQEIHLRFTGRGKRAGSIITPLTDLFNWVAIGPVGWVMLSGSFPCNHQQIWKKSKPSNCSSSLCLHLVNSLIASLVSTDTSRACGEDCSSEDQLMPHRYR